MPDLGQAQTGSLRSTPKQLKVSASDKAAALFKCMGNNHNVPFEWVSQVTVASGTDSVLLASGIKFYDMELASNATVVATPTSDPGGRFWVEQNTDANTVTLVVGSSVSADTVFGVHFTLGAGIDISTLSTRGTGAPAQSYP